jgi:hypothetical protein
MRTNNILPWRPKGHLPVAVLYPKLLWTVQKQQWQIDCILQGCDTEGWSVRVLLNGDWFFCCQFPSMKDAMEAADDKYTELLNGGWAASTLQ